ncbi:hypothetical protein M432DRAFT_221125 [Thermoascus aurantiacus ATCC 26904]
MSPRPTFHSALLVALALHCGWARASMEPVEIQNSCNSLATSALVLKDLVLLMDSTSNSGPVFDFCKELEVMFDHVVANIGFMTGSPVIQRSTDQQIVYDGYSNFVQSLVELMDAVTKSAATLVEEDDDNEFRIVSEIRALSGVIDAYFYNLIGLFPKATSYHVLANDQKSQVDTHFRRAVHSFSLLPDKFPDSDPGKDKDGKSPKLPNPPKVPDSDKDGKFPDPDKDRKSPGSDKDGKFPDPDKDRKSPDSDKDGKFPDPDKDKKDPDHDKDKKSPDSDEEFLDFDVDEEFSDADSDEEFYDSGVHPFEHVLAE